MKKSILFLMGVLLYIIFMSNVNAAELPSSGVTYFITYPDGEEVITESYEEASSNPEKIIFEGVTDSEGKVVLEGLSNKGELRVVQTIPNGYTSESKEYTLDLSKSRNVEIINSVKKLTNPKTSSIIVPIILICFVLLSLFLLRTKRVEKFFLMVVVVSTMIILYQVNASSSEVVVKVIDDNGKALSGVSIIVYAKPSIVEGYPAIKLDANGGTFFDGKTLMYIKMPYSGCRFIDVILSLDENERRYVMDNSMGAYRSNYLLTKNSNWENISSNLRNGDVIRLTWEYDDEVQLVKVYGNGGAVDFYGKALTELTLYSDAMSKFLGQSYFLKENEVFIGFDLQSNCPAYNQYGIIDSLLNHDLIYNNETADMYACWHSQPDGVYVNNDYVFVGNIDTCYSQSVSNYYDNRVCFYDKNFEFGIQNDPYYFFGIYDFLNDRTINITSAKIIDHGEVYLSLSSNDFEKDDYNYYITNNSKYETFEEAIYYLFNHCGGYWFDRFSR